MLLIDSEKVDFARRLSKMTFRMPGINDHDHLASQQGLLVKLIILYLFDLMYVYVKLIRQIVALQFFSIVNLIELL